MLSEGLNIIPCLAWCFKYHREGICVQLVLMSRESLTLQAANKHALQVNQVTQSWRSVRFWEGTTLFGKLL